MGEEKRKADAWDEAKAVLKLRDPTYIPQETDEMQAWPIKVSDVPRLEHRLQHTDGGPQAQSDLYRNTMSPLGRYGIEAQQGGAAPMYSGCPGSYIPNRSAASARLAREGKNNPLRVCT